MPGGPLEGVRVLDITSVVMGPYATQLLGDLGADVIVVEPPRGDNNRSMGPGPHPQLSGVALNLLRNKRNVAIDFKRPEGRDAVLAIATSCDVVVTNLRPGALKRAGIDYAAVAARRPDIVYCQAHGYPSDGARADSPAYDDVIQVETGVADATARVSGRPAISPQIVADKVCGLTVVYAVLASLFRRERTGMGEHIEVPMFDVMRAFTLVEHGAAAIPDPPLGAAGYGRVLAPERGPWPTRDGWVMALPYTREHYDSIFAGAGRDDLIGDPRYSTGRARVANSSFLYGLLAEMMLQRTTEEWLRFFAEHDVPAAPVATLDEMVDGLPMGDHPVAGAYRVVPPPVRFYGAPQQVRRPAPLIGEHTEEVLAEIGYDGQAIGWLRQSGALGQVPPEFA